MKKKTLLFLLFVLLFLPLAWPFFHSGYFPTHDGEWAVVRLGAMHRALMAGQFPVRWAGNLNFGYGYPLFLFTYPLPYYLGEVFNFLGFGLVGSIKILFVLSVFFSGVAMFWLGKELFGRLGGILAAVFYLYAPFRLVDLYVRGSLGESLAFVFYPLLFWLVLKLARGAKWATPVGAIFFAGLFLTHNVSALLFGPFLLAWSLFWVFRTKVKERPTLIRQLLVMFGLGFSLAAFFLIPALVEKSQIVLGQKPLADISQHFVGLKQLIIPGWGYGAPLSDDPFSFQLGWVHLLGLGLPVYLVFKKADRSNFALFCLACFFFSVLMVLPVSSLLWRYLPLFSEIDFPWRILGLSSFFLALNLGFLGEKKRLWPLVLGLVFLVVGVNLGYAKPSGLVDYGDDYYLTNEATTTSADELMPIWVAGKPTQRSVSKAEVISGEAEIKNLVSDSKKTSFGIKAEQSVELQVNTIYFPGWQLRVDGQSAPLDYDNEKGVMRFEVPAGEHQIELGFGETSLRLLADLISLLSLGLTVFLFLKLKSKR